MPGGPRCVHYIYFGAPADDYDEEGKTDDPDPESTHLPPTFVQLNCTISTHLEFRFGQAIVHRTCTVGQHTDELWKPT